jgi:hypothetical protein
MSPHRNTPADADLLERPLNARSVIGSLLLGVHPPRLPGARIVEWCTRFGIAEGTARVALSRMVDRGELVGERGVYELAGRVRELQGAQDWSLEPHLRPWHGSWRFGMVGAFRDAAPRDARARAALRDVMRRLRYARLREGVWTRPDNLPMEAGPAESWTIADAQCEWWTGRSRPTCSRPPRGQREGGRCSNGSTVSRATSTPDATTRSRPASSPVPLPCSTRAATHCSRPHCCPATGPATSSGPPTCGSRRRSRGR